MASPFEVATVSSPEKGRGQGGSVRVPPDRLRNLPQGVSSGQQAARSGAQQSTRVVAAKLPSAARTKRADETGHLPLEKSAQPSNTPSLAAMRRYLQQLELLDQ